MKKPLTDEEVVERFNRLIEAINSDPELLTELEQPLEEDLDTTMGYDTLAEKEMDREP